MKSLKLPIHLLLILLIFIITNCKDREVTNPFDEGCPKELFTSSNFKAEQQGTAVKLSWSQSNQIINGFVINRSENDGALAEVTRIDKAFTTWTDNKVSGGTKYGYQLFAYAGANLSNPLTASITTPVLGATVTTVSAATTITPNSAVLGGNVTSDGGASITERGICYATSANPTIANSKAVMGNGTGIFNGTVTGLAGNTTYYAKAFATNSYGTAYGTEITFTTTQLLPATVSTTAAASITTISAVLGGNVTGDGGATVTERGVCYGTAQNPTIANSKLAIGNGIGTFSNTITGLTEGTTYYAKAYATNSQGTAYGSQITFATLSLSLATVTTADATNVTGTSAVIGGNVTNDGNSTVTERGVCYSTSQNPTTAGTKIVIGTGTGTYNNTVTNLADGTKYYARAYSINSKGTAYGAEISFTTTQISLATVTSAAAGNIGSTTAVLGGSVTSDGNSAVSERGVCYSSSQNPTTANSKFAIGTGTGAFSNTVSGLTSSTTYYVRAYAINGKGTAYGNEVSFKTTVLISLATVTTDAITNLKTNGATLAGNVTNDGGATVTERGICYNTSGNPTTNSPKIIIGNGTGTFSSIVTGLQVSTTYQVRAYAINSMGTAYGNQVSFTTLAFVGVPTLTTTDANNIAQTTATSGGNITADGGADVTARGICYSTNQNPTLADNLTTDGTGNGQFVSQMTSLLPGTTYYIRAYATNNAGTAYGNQITCPTLKSLPIVTTKSITDVSAVGCVSGGIITSTGGGTISERGICWSESPNPIITDQKATSTSTTPSFSAAVGNVIPGTIYYIKAYATNEIGTSYGDQKTFTTSDAAYYQSFETGIIPTGWTGPFTVTNAYAFNGSYSLMSLYGKDCDATFTTTLTTAGQIIFYYRFVGYCVQIDFYIDDVLIATYPTGSGWRQGLAPVTAGTHKFTWHYKDYSSLYGQNEYRGNCYIDQIVITK